MSTFQWIPRHLFLILVIMTGLTVGGFWLNAGGLQQAQNNMVNGLTNTVANSSQGRLISGNNLNMTPEQAQQMARDMGF